MTPGAIALKAGRGTCTKGHITRRPPLTTLRVAKKRAVKTAGTPAGAVMQRSVVVGGVLISAGLVLALLFNCSATREAVSDGDMTVQKPRPAAVPVLHQASDPGSSRLEARGGGSRLLSQ